MKQRNHAYPVTLYSIFDISPGVTDEELHDTYRTLCAAWHPDSPSGGDINRFQSLTAAYAQLKTVEGRRTYDAQLAAMPGQCPTCDGAGRRFKPLASFSLRAYEFVECVQCEGTGQKALSETRSAFPARAGRPR